MSTSLIIAILIGATVLTNAQISYPQTRRVGVADTIHGTIVTDPYRWLENDRDPEVEAWVAEQAKTTESYLLKIPYRYRVLDRLHTLTNFVRYSAPWHRAGITFYYKNTGAQNHNVLYMKRDGSTEAEVLLDPNTFSDDGTVGLAFASESLDGKYLAFGKTEGGSDWNDIYIIDLSTKQILPEVIKWTKNSGVSWHEGGFYYSRYQASDGKEKSLTEKNSYQSVMYHKLGTAQDSDQLIFSDPDHPEQFVGCYVLERSEYLIRYVRQGASDGNEIYVRPLREQSAPWKKIFASTTTSFYPSHDEKGTLYGTSTDGAPNGKVVRIADPLGAASFETVIAERENVLDAVSYASGRMFLTWMIHVHHEVEIADMKGKVIGKIELPGLGTVSGFGGELEDTTLYYTFTAHTYPTTIFEYTVATGASRVWQKVEAKFDPEQFAAEQVFVTSKDGTRIPMFILSLKGLPKTGTAPTILYGYGGFNVSLYPSFNANLIPWLEQGGVVAIANLRGGGEYGEAWHKAGMRTQKQNVFDDAIACAEWLISHTITQPGLLAINGGSNGGLLVGAVVNQRPDLFRVAVPEVGVMDMLRFQLFTIGWNWQADYGEITNSDEFKAMYAYSPYHQLREKVNYPSTMIMTADHDDRVVPAHSFKYAAMLQHVYKGDRPMLLRVQIKSGHGAVNRDKQLEGVADKYSFMWYEMGVTPSY
ncbi:MAG: S9 family peptidase [Ignavibacteria bacterium]|nr:S9 family peptidase [Ignavibacteria bacterium]